MSEVRITRQRAASAAALDKNGKSSQGVPADSSSSTKNQKSNDSKMKMPNRSSTSSSSSISRIKKHIPVKSETPSTTPKRTRKSGPLSDMEKALAALKKSQEEAKKVSIEDIRNLKKEFNKTIDKAKRAAQEQDERESLKKPAKTTRSGLKRGALKKIEEYTQGKIILNGMRDAKNKTPFCEEEIKYLEGVVPKVKQVKDLKYEYLQYLVNYIFLPELKGVQKGDIKSAFHDRYHELLGKSKNELYSEMRLTLFTNEQRDYLNGYLQEIFDANKKDESNNIDHALISYVEIVMLYECTLRIVKYVHKFATFEETLAFMKKKSREAYGISDDEE